jgi:hypothetical protein
MLYFVFYALTKSVLGNVGKKKEEDGDNDDTSVIN